jgi:hypothetical protein
MGLIEHSFDVDEGEVVPVRIYVALGTGIRAGCV